MDDLARGWAIVMEQVHGHGRGLAIWIAIIVPSAVAIWIAVFADRKPTAKGSRDEGMTPKKRPPLPRSYEGEDRPQPRAPLPGPDRGFRE